MFAALRDWETVWPPFGERRAHHMARIDQRHGNQEDNQTLAYAEIEECRFMATGLDQCGDSQNCQSRTRHETGSGETGRQTTAVGKPLQCIADASAIHRPGAHTANRRGKIKQRERVGKRIHYPADPA